MFGVKNEQISEVFEKNQKCKEPIIISYILLALAKSREKLSDEVSFAELFCADGYYAMVARYLGYFKSFGIDNDRDGYFSLAEKIRDSLNLDNVFFIKEDVNNLDKLDKVNVVANVGGLYHVSNPEEILEKSYNMAKRFLIVQSVVSMTNDDENYFESPAHGWNWGCRFNKNSFHKMIVSKGWKIIDYHFNELEGNERPEDRGSVYYLIEKKNKL